MNPLFIVTLYWQFQKMLVIRYSSPHTGTIPIQVLWCARASKSRINYLKHLVT